MAGVKKTLVRTSPAHVVLPGGDTGNVSQQGFDPKLVPQVGPVQGAGASAAKPTLVRAAEVLPTRSIRDFFAKLQFDPVTHFRREVYRTWVSMIAGAPTERAIDNYIVPTGTVLVLTCIRYRIVKLRYAIIYPGAVVKQESYFMHDEALLHDSLLSNTNAFKTTINGASISYQQFVWESAVLDGYYILNQNIIPPGYEMQTVAIENQAIQTVMFQPNEFYTHTFDQVPAGLVGVETYGFTIPIHVWDKYKSEYAP